MSGDLVLLAILMGAVTYPSRAIPFLAPGIERLRLPVEFRQPTLKRFSLLVELGDQRGALGLAENLPPLDDATHAVVVTRLRSEATPRQAPHRPP